MKKQAILAAPQSGPGSQAIESPDPGRAAGRDFARFGLSRRWNQLPGCAYGVAQPALIGGLRVYVPDGHDADALDRWMTAVLEAPVPDDAPAAGTAHALAHRAIHWALVIQRRHRIPLPARFLVEHRGVATEDGLEMASFFVAMPVAHAEASKASLAWVARAIGVLLGEGGAAAEQQARLAGDRDALARTLAKFAESGQNREFIVQHAHDAAIPVHRVVPGHYRLGIGRHARLLDSSITDRTPAIGVAIARDKMRTAVLLRQAGLPAPIHQAAADEDDAVRIANRLGYPVVVKPADQDQGKGVFADLRDDANVASAYRAARGLSRTILVEKHFEGAGHRLTVFDGRVVKATRKMPAGVTGDGALTIEQLVLQAQQQAREAPARTAEHAVVLTLDDEAHGMLAQQGLSPAAVPDAGVFVCLRRRNNAIAGGTTTRLELESVHPDNLRLAVRAAQALRLDWAGIDLLIEDTARSWIDTGGLICEVNAQPQVDRRTAGAIIDAMMAGDGRIPVHLAICRDEADRTPQGALLAAARRLGCGGFASAAGVWIDGVRITPAQASGFHAARILLDSPEVDAALCVMTPDEIVRYGLPVDRLDSACLIGGERFSDAQKRALARAMRMLKPHLAADVGR